MSDDIPFDQWVEIPDQNLEKKGKTQWVYRPSNYPGPIALDATIEKKKHHIQINVSKTHTT